MHKEHIMIGVPTLSGEISLQLHQVLMELGKVTARPDLPFAFSVRFGHALRPVHFARNVLVGEFLKSGADRLLMMDDDMLPDENTFGILYVDADIVVPRMFQFVHAEPDKKATAGFRLLALKKTESGRGYRPMDPVLGESAVQEIDASGTGCILIKRRVLEDRRLWRDGSYTKINGEQADVNEPGEDGKWAPAIFNAPCAPNGMWLMGEDIDFTSRAKALGYKVVADLNSACSHYKRIIIDQAAMTVVHGVVNAINGLKDGSNVIKYPGLEDKILDGPPHDRMLRREGPVLVVQK